MTNEEFKLKLVELARNWATSKIPFQHRGASRKGCDCIGLFVGIMKELGMMVNFQLPFYERDWNRGKDPEVLTKNFSPYYEVITREELEPGDMILFAFAGRVIHSGIYIGDNLFVHSHQGSNVRIDTLRLSPWTSRVHYFIRLKLEALSQL